MFSLSLFSNGVLAEIEVQVYWLVKLFALQLFQDWYSLPIFIENIFTN